MQGQATIHVPKKAGIVACFLRENGLESVSECKCGCEERCKFMSFWDGVGLCLIRYRKIRTEEIKKINDRNKWRKQ